MDEFDFVIIGAGAAGEAAAHEARRRGATVAIIERELFGGSCPFWACMPSKALLHAASIHKLGGDYGWPRASDGRDWIISREERDWPDDASHVRSLSTAGAEVIRGEAHITGPGMVGVALANGSRELAARNLIIAVGTHSTVPDLPGLDQIEPWTNKHATSTRQLPRSLAILGGGPTGVELAQVFARYGVRVTLVHSEPRLNHRDHPGNSAVLTAALRNDGVDLRLGDRAESVQPHAGRNGAHVVRLSDGSSVEGHDIMLSIGRTAPLAELGLENIGVELSDGRLKPDDRLQIAPNTFVVGDPAGPEMHTHLAHYQGEISVRIALGENVTPDFSAIPRAVYTDPEAAGVGQQLSQATERGIDAFEKTADLAKSAKGQVSEATGHVAIVVDRADPRLVGAFVAGPGASEAIHMAVLAVKARTHLGVLADTITAFPTVSRVMGTLFVEAARELKLV